MEKRAHFNLSHELSKVISASKIDISNLEMNPENIDLRFFSMICLGDTYNGGCAVAEGLKYVAILYGNRIVYSYQKHYNDCDEVGFNSDGSVFYSKMYSVACLFKEVVGIGHRKFFNETQIVSPKLEEGWDCVGISRKETLTALQAHPQYKGLVENFGLELEPIKNRELSFRVLVTKHFTRTIT